MPILGFQKFEEYPKVFTLSTAAIDCPSLIHFYENCKQAKNMNSKISGDRK